MRVEFQIIHNSNENFLSNITYVVKSILEQDYISDSNLDDIGLEVKLKYNIEKENLYISGVLISVEEDEELQAKHLLDIASVISDEEYVLGVTKYFDSKMQFDYSKYYQEIFEVEMRIREVFTFIFYYNNTDNYWDLLNDVNIRKQTNNGNKIDENYYKSHYENEFFFLLFSDYIKLDSVKEIKINDLSSILQECNSFEEFKDFMTSRGITEPKHIEFIKNIKEYVNSIEVFRNCIAHNRSYLIHNNKIFDSYDYAKTELIRAIDEFWQIIRNDGEF